ncbi:hypothetical protein N9B24_01025 [bacterium]|nr:hypothetical protein [bacterium]
MTELFLKRLLSPIISTALLTAIALGTSDFLMAAGPNTIDPQRIQRGRALFEREWPSRNPNLGSDGRGPLHNAKSCVACHHQGGVGGSGDARFNAKSISIEKMKITGGPINNDVIANSVKRFHPGFVDPMGKVINTFALSHHGGTPVFSSYRDSLMKHASAEFSEEGGPANAAEVRHANATPLDYSSQNGRYKVAIHARIFQRNTTPLFGSGLIDQITAKQLKDLARDQEKHPEISGRPATRPDGRYGRFGWRGNIATLIDFCDQACAAEMGLETARIPQPLDPTLPGYQNPTTDISDEQIRTMAAFVAALPAPSRRFPQDSEARHAAVRGEQLFASVGCAVCHVPTVSPAVGLYSDLLMHDMGQESIDLNPADPYITRITPVSRVDQRVVQKSENIRFYDDALTTSYYGSTSVMSGTISEQRSTTKGSTAVDLSPINRRQTNIRYSPTSYEFTYPKQPDTLMRFVPTGSEIKRSVKSSQSNQTDSKRTLHNQTLASGKDTYTIDRTKRNVELTETKRTNYTRIHIEPTNTMQEWRTPPLWGVRDSAPYLHDGRAATLLEAVSMHEGEAAGTRDRFLNLSHSDRSAIINFMETLVAPRNVPKADL